MTMPESSPRREARDQSQELHPVAVLWVVSHPRGAEWLQPGDTALFLQSAAQTPAPPGVTVYRDAHDLGDSLLPNALSADELVALLCAASRVLHVA